MAASTNKSLELNVQPLSEANFGVKINGLNPSRISEEQKILIWDVYRENHGLICFEFDRLLDAGELYSLTAVFGENEFAPGKINGIGKKALPSERHLTVDEQVAIYRARGEDPYISFIGNVDPKTLKATPTVNKFFGEWEWHTDMSYIQIPPTFSLLHSRKIPEEGGDTGFCSQVMAARAISKNLRKRVLNLQIKHDSTYGSSGILRPGMTPPVSPVEAIGCTHPIIRKVPSTGDEALFLGRRTNAYVVGLSLSESEELLDELWNFATQPEFQYRHSWKVGQVVTWDNRMMLHMRYPFDENLARFMWRTQTKGEPVRAAT